jgi:hypothetical protein
VPDVHAVLQPEDLLDGIALEKEEKWEFEFRNIGGALCRARRNGSTFF